MITLNRFASLILISMAAILGVLAPIAVEAAESSLSVVRITPSGEDVPAARQLVIEFDRAVVPLGRMDRSAEEIPVSIAPKIACEWRWLSDRALACELKESDALKASTQYSVTVKPGLVAQDGTTLAKPITHDFITERVALDRVGFSEWTGPSMPSLLVTFNQPVRRDSVANHLSFNWKGGTGAVIATEGPDWSQSPDDALVDVPREPGFIGIFKRLLSYIPWLRSETTAAPHEWARRTWAIKPVSPLPTGIEAELDMAPGLISGLGPERSIAEQQVKKFATFGEFKFVGLRCNTNKGETITIRPDETQSALCGPWSLIRLVFSSPIQLKQIRDHVTLSPELGKPAPDVDPWADADLDQTEGYYSWKGHSLDDEYTARFPVYLRSDRDYEVAFETR